MTIHLKQIKYEVIFEPLEGQIECGDQYFIKELADCILIAVVDGLGHGAEAAFAAKKAIQTLDAHANESIETLFKLCNEALCLTRGAAMTIFKIDTRYKLTYMGIGNVMGACWKINESGKLIHNLIVLDPGIVGSRLFPSMQVKEIAMSPGDTFILATDGIKIQFESEPPKVESPEKIAKHIFNTYRNKNDDGLILVAQLL